jgi:hypothetical protein
MVVGGEAHEYWTQQLVDGSWHAYTESRSAFGQSESGATEELLQLLVDDVVTADNPALVDLSKVTV